MSAQRSNGATAMTKDAAMKAAPADEFAVLMPVYWGDQPQQVESAFRSVTLDQELAPSQVVIVRDGPVGPGLAGLLERLAQTCQVSLLKLPVNGGLAKALNAGLAACRFDVVARQDADDVSAASRFGLMVPLVQSGQFDLIGSAVQEITADPVRPVKYGPVRSYPLTSEEIWRTAKRMNPFAHPTVVMRRDLVLSLGGYREFFHMEDYDLWVRLLCAGARAGNLLEPLVNYRVSTAGWRRRGGWRTLRSELALQRHFVESGFINRAEWLRNVTVRGSVELAPPAVLRLALRQAWR
jgi:glycosyltransferase involved in cell wall biosynthesis